jgi:hypothetical protein
MKTALAHMIRSYHFSVDESKPFIRKFGITLGVKQGMHVFVKNR